MAISHAFHSTSYVSVPGKEHDIACDGKTSQCQLDAATEAVDAMEPELRQLAGLVMTLRFLGEADDSIEPLAISAIAGAADSTLDQIDAARRRAVAALRKPEQSQPETRR